MGFPPRNRGERKHFTSREGRPCRGLIQRGPINVHILLSALDAIIQVNECNKFIRRGRLAGWQGPKIELRGGGGGRVTLGERGQTRKRRRERVTSGRPVVEEKNCYEREGKVVGKRANTRGTLEK